MKTTLILAALSAVYADSIDINPLESQNHLLTTTPMQKTIEQDHFWAAWDMTMGILIGGYVPLLRYTRNEDCYSHFWDLASSCIRYHKFFDGEALTGSVYANLGLMLVFDIRSLVTTYTTCKL